MVSVTVTLRHHATQRLVRRHFDQIDHSLYVSTKVLREERRDEEAQQIEQVVVTTLEQFEQEVVGMTNKMAGSEKMLGSHFKVGSPSFDQEAEISVNCSTGLATRILTVVWTVDCMLAEIDRLEVISAISSTEAFSIQRLWIAKLRSLFNALKQVRNRSSINRNAQKTGE